MSHTQKTKLIKRLLPLYISVFFHGFVLWYVIEKLFMVSIGFDDAGIGMMVAAYSAIMLVVETPSGILADMWSRKGVLILASIALGVSGFICGISTEPILYIFGVLFWGIFYALYSGTYDSMVYDTLVEETGGSEGYGKYFGRVRLVDSIALIASSLLGGVIAQVSGLASVYFLSIPFAFFAIIALVWFKEPQLHKMKQHDSVKKHVVETFHSVLGKRSLLKLLIVIIILTLVNELLGEFYQLWLIGLAVAPLFFGPASAVFLSAIGLGGVLAGKVKDHSRFILLFTFIIMFIGGMGLVYSHIATLSVLFQAILGAGTIFLSILFMRDLHDQLPSSIRAGASSAVSTMSRLVFIPTAFLFGVLSDTFSIFNASWIFVFFIVLCGGIAIFFPTTE